MDISNPVNMLLFAFVVIIFLRVFYKIATKGFRDAMTLRTWSHLLVAVALALLFIGPFFVPLAQRASAVAAPDGRHAISDFTAGMWPMGMAGILCAILLVASVVVHFVSEERH